MKEIKIVNTRREADEVLAEAWSKETGALDIETTVVEDPFVELPELVSVAVTFDGEKAWVFTPKGWQYAARELQDVAWIMQNGAFDVLMVRLLSEDRQLRTDLRLAHDTMAMAYLLGDYESKGLEALSEAILGEESYKDVNYKKILEEPFEKVAEMNGEDACRTFRLFRPLADRLNADPQLLRIYKWLLMPAVKALTDITFNGVPIDMSRLSKISEKISGDFRNTESELLLRTPAPLPDEYPDSWPVKRKADEPRFNPNSYQQVGHVLFDVFKLDPINITESGNRSTSEDVLTQLLLKTSGDVEAWIETLLRYRTLAKQMSSYIEAWPRFIADGRMHPRFKPLHVVTGRLSSEAPNIQQVPRDKDFRNVFGGYGTWVKADYSQIELRIAAWLAQEPTMLEAYREGLDLHRLTATLILGDESDDARQVGKTLNFGLLYGAGVGTLRRVARMDYGVDLTEAQAYRYRDEFFETYPALKLWHEKTEVQVLNNHYVRSPLGRIRYLPKAADFWDTARQWAAVREGINMPVQSFASDLLLMSLVRLNEKIPGKIVAAVHDEIDMVFDPGEEVPTSLIQETMEDVSWLERFGVHLTVPVVVDIESGTHWGSVE